MADEQIVTEPGQATPKPGEGEPAKEAPPAATPKEGTAAPPAEPAKPKDTAAAPPEKYDLKLPEDSLLDEKALEGTVSYAKERGLSNEQAQELVERESFAISEYVTRMKGEAENWIAEAKGDEELGGDSFNKNVEMARRVVEKFGSDKFKEALNDSGLGNHPEVVRVFKRIAESMGEDSLVQPGAAAKPAKSMAEILYPETSKPQET